MPLQPRIPRPASTSWQRLSDTPLDDFLRRVDLFAKAVRGGEFVGWTLAIAVAAVLVALFSDAFFAWPAAVRIGWNLVAAAGLLTSAVVLGWRMFGRRYHARTVARLAEDGLHRRDSLLINAVEFRSGLETGSETLRASVVQSADSIVATLPASAVTPPSPAVRATLAGLAAVMAFGIALLIAPRLFATVIPRFLDPLGDHPPFTLLTFAPTVKPDPLHRGKPALVTVEITGPERVEEAVLILRPAGETRAPTERLPMFRQSETTFSGQVARVDVDTEFHIETPRGRSGWFEMKVSQTPLIEEARATLTFPAYTGWKPREQRLDDRGVRGLRGTKCLIAVRSNLVLKEGEIQIFSAEGGTTADVVLPLTPDSGDRQLVRGEVSIETNGRFELVVRSESGHESDVLTGPIVALRDRPPLVAITAPAETLIAVEGWTIPVEIQASDDIGVERIRLFRGVNGWSPSAVTLPHETDQAGVALAKTEFDLGALGAKAGDVIEYYASADDRASGRPQSTDTPTSTIQVISEEEYKDFARQQYQLDELSEEFETFRKELERLAEERQKAAKELEELLRKQAAGDALTDADRERMERLEKQMGDFARDAAELARTLQERAEEMPLYDLEQQYTEELKKLAKELSSQSENAERIAELLKHQQDSSSPKLSEELEDAAEQFLKESGPFDAPTQDQMEQLTDDLQTLQKADALNEQVERLQAVTAEQRQLANRLSELAGKTSLMPDEQARADQFAKEQELLAQELESVRKQLEESAREAEEKLPKMAESARQLVESLDQLAISQEQMSAAQQARDQQGDAAHRHAESAARKLESLMEAAGDAQNSEGLQEGLDGPLRLSQQQVRNTLDQMRRSRRPPGLGQRGQKGGRSPGNSEGESEGGSAGGQSRGGNQGRMRPGQSARRGDSNAQVMGPRTQEAVESSDQSATMQADGKGRFVLPGVTGDTPSAESLTPQSRNGEGLSGTNLRGVPVGYRDAAEAYFRRLSEEKDSK
ncbi:hypothetical protein Pan44_33100 [Caulifigura coniformis]|uniref:Uncharacterized protein n=1 Tax=Caulifigura coniformis TaxID=2527983 RepID=A0A517SGQ1_9PLAN|nr:hypothetical protein [Caulifigura coniformis]QDT55267.1 hypothetical protein Pan44_33100 [Caulifigura coniformis]